MRTNPHRIKLVREALSREEKKELLISRYHPEEYESPPTLMKELITPAESKNLPPEYSLDRSGLKRLIEEETEQALEFIQVPSDRGLPFDHVAVVVLSERRARRALMHTLAHTFKALAPVQDTGDVTASGRSKRRKNKGTVELKEEWLTVNLPSVALVHIMHPKVACEYDFKEIWNQQE